MSTIAQISLEEYERAAAAGVFEGRRLEYIRGEVREMSPKGDRHEDLVDCLAEWSHDVVRGKPVRVRVQSSIRLSGVLGLPEPDVVWVVRRRYSRRKPEAGDVYLLIEVAETSLSYDLGEKAEIYAEAGIRDYWVVDAAASRIVVHRDPGKGRYRSVLPVPGNQEIRPLAFPEIALRPEVLWEE
jgi:Uma2 family endonuclease